MMTDSSAYQYQVASNDNHRSPSPPNSITTTTMNQQQTPVVIAQPTMQQTQFSSSTMLQQPSAQQSANNTQLIDIKSEEIQMEPLEITDDIKAEKTDLKPPILIQPPPQHENRNVVGRLSYQEDVLYMFESNRIVIGRNSSTSNVHFHVGRNSFISRKHFQIIHDSNNKEFYVVVSSKNGIFIDDQFNRKSSDPELLPNMCTFRFPSTDIRILFENLSDGEQKKSLKHPNDNGVYAPLKIKIPKIEKKSPPLSPTGTLSAANSCPTSPRQSFRDYHNSNAYNNYNNNNGLQNDALPAAPSTSQNEHEKPLYSYAQLIVQAVSAAPEKQLTLSGIYSFITKHYPYYRKEANKGWQNSIRHNLSLNRYFLKVERSQDEPGKGSFWRIDPNSEAKLIDQSYRKRRQRGSQCFRTPYGMPRSAPASPSQLSRDNSPLHDILLQSAPGSPDNNSYQQQQQQRNGSGGGVGTLPVWQE
ncbi:hypothetical protein HA402_014379 [Bradysia odoriphaga]|nr:hypothetical protein HA402_014379 [Bradysia odoriphaga]